MGSQHGPDVVKLPWPARPNIEEVLQHFLEDRTESLAPATSRSYAGVIQLFTISMNHYGYEPLSKAEEAAFHRFYDAKGDEHREFCQVFGPQKIPQNVGEFLGYFMPRKVICGRGLNQAARVVIRRLARWLCRNGHIDKDAAAAMITRSKAR